MPPVRYAAAAGHFRNSKVTFATRMGTSAYEGPISDDTTGSDSVI
jgi:hypothetical protein